MSSETWVIHFSADHAREGNPHSRHHITRALAERYRIAWINPYGFRRPSLWRGGLIRKAIRKFSHWAEGTRVSQDGWVIANPVQLPIFTRSRWQPVNDRLLGMQLRRLCRRHGIRRAILLFTTPRYASAVRLLRPWPAVFYFSDAYSKHRELSAAEQVAMRTAEDELIRVSKRVLCCSTPLYREMIARAEDPSKVALFPHQVDYERFRAARERSSPPADVRAIPRPIIGYYGTLTDSNDWETARYAVERRPNYSFVFIGKKEIAHTGLEDRPNVHFLGFRPFETIPDYGAAFDVAIMFWVRREWIRNCSPLKLREYLALGRPVVSTFIEDVAENFGDIVPVAHSPEEFLAALDARVADPNPAAIQKGIARVREDSWRRILPYFESLTDAGLS